MCPFFLPLSFGSCYEFCSTWNILLPSTGFQNIAYFPVPCYLFHEIFSGSSHLRKLLHIHPHGICFGQDSIGCTWQTLSSKWLQQNKEFIDSTNWKLQAYFDLSVWTTWSGVSQSLSELVMFSVNPLPSRGLSQSYILTNKKRTFFLDNRCSQIASHQPSWSHMSTLEPITMGMEENRTFWLSKPM